MKTYTVRRSIVPTASSTCSRCLQAPPSIACQCAPNLQYCRACYGEHFFDPGDHKPVPLPTAPRASLPASLHENPEFTGPDNACLKCGRAAKEICACQHPVIYLCSACVTEHVDSDPDKEHVTLPLSAVPHLTTTEAIGRLKRRANQLEQAKDKFQEVYSSMDHAEQGILAMLDGLAAKVEDLKAKTKTDISHFREDLQSESEAALTEVNNHIWEENYRGSSHLARLLFDYKEDRSAMLQNIFEWAVDPSKAIAELERASSVKLTLTDPGAEEQKEQSRCLPILNSTSLRLFDTATRRETQFLPLSEAICINETSTWMVKGNVVIASGKMYPLSAAVYEVSMSTGHVTAKKPMLIARYFHAMVYYARTRKYYVFGGTGGTPEHFQQRCEVHDSLLEQWAYTTGSLREGRDCFNPVQVEDKFFIVGGRNAKSVELFSTTTELFTQMLVTLPAATSTVAVREDGDILILQRDKAIRWKPLGTELKTVPVKDGLSMFSNTPPLRCGNDLFILRCVNCCVSTLTFNKPTDPVQCSKTPVIY